MDGDALLRKLQVKAGESLVLIGAPPQIEAALEGRLVLREPGQACDCALAFCNSPADVAALAPQAMTGLVADGVLWFAFRKGAAGKAAGLTRDVGWEALAAQGYETVRAIAFDDEWSGLRFRETWRVKPRAERMERLFSYGTLQQEAVQIATFGRRLKGAPDALPGFRLGRMTITNPDVVGVSGAAEHLVALASDDPADAVPGVVFEVTAQELAAADVYESADYRRVAVQLTSGIEAWLYVTK